MNIKRLISFALLVSSFVLGLLVSISGTLRFLYAAYSPSFMGAILYEICDGAIPALTLPVCIAYFKAKRVSVVALWSFFAVALMRGVNSEWIACSMYRYSIGCLASGAHRMIFRQTAVSFPFLVALLVASDFWLNLKASRVSGPGSSN